MNKRKLTKEDKIKEEVVNTFQIILPETEEWKLSINGLFSSTLDREESRPLEDPFFSEEVHIASYSSCQFVWGQNSWSEWVHFGFLAILLGHS